MLQQIKDAWAKVMADKNLEKALHLGDVELLQHAVDSGAQINDILVLAEDDKTCTEEKVKPMVCALWHGNWVVGGKMLAVLKQAGATMTPLMQEAYDTRVQWGMENDKTDMVADMVQAAPELDYQEKMRYSVLHNKPQMVDIFAKAGANVDEIDNAWFSLLMLAARRGHAGAMTALLDNGADMGHLNGYDTVKTLMEKPLGVTAVCYPMERRAVIVADMKKAIARAEAIRAAEAQLGKFPEEIKKGHLPALNQIAMRTVIHQRD